MQHLKGITLSEPSEPCIETVSPAGARERSTPFWASLPTDIYPNLCQVMFGASRAGAGGRAAAARK